MPYAGEGSDALALLLTGGASNTNPDSSLGGVVSSTRIRGLGAIFGDTIPAIKVENATPACGEGSATLYIDADGKLVFTPPGGGAGLAVSIAAGAGAVVQGSNKNKGLRVSRESGSTLPYAIGKQMTLDLRTAMNGALAQADLTSAQRAAGRTSYRGIMLKAHGPHAVRTLRVWLPVVSGGQATWAIGTETVVGSSIQTIANETTAPTAVTFSSPTTEGAALSIGDIRPGEMVGLWIRRTFPSSGVVDPRENMQLATKFFGGTS